MAINAEWHKKNKMPKNATAAQRLKWHIGHQKNCKCRPMTMSQILKMINKSKKK